MIEIIRKYLDIGQKIEISLANEKVLGELLDIDEIGVLLKTSKGKRFIKGTKIDDFEIIDSCISTEAHEKLSESTKSIIQLSTTKENSKDKLNIAEDKIAKMGSSKNGVTKMGSSPELRINNS